MFQSCSAEFLTFKKQISRKIFSVSVLKYLEICQWKVFNEAIFVKKQNCCLESTRLQKKFYIFFKRISESCCFKNFRNSSKTSLVVKQFELSGVPPLTALNTDSIAEDFEHFLSIHSQCTLTRPSENKLQRYCKQTLNQFFYRCFENFGNLHEEFCNGVPF